MIDRRFLLLATAALAGCAGVPGGLAGRQAPTKPIALTYDDVPRRRGAFLTPHERTRRLIAALKAARVQQAAFFLNPGHLGTGDGAGGERRIAAYVAAGHVIANHSNTHPHLSQLTADAYLAEIDAAERWLAGRPGRRPWFRFPYLDEGGRDKAKRDAARAGLAARDLRNGYVTAEASDWLMEQNTVDAVAAGKQIDRAGLRDLYVESHVGAAEFADALMVRTIGRSPAHFMLLHETDLAALFLPDLVAGLRAKGWTIVTVDEAYADPIGDLSPDVPSAQGTLTKALAWEAGLPAPRWYERNTESIANRLFAERVLREPAP